MNLKQIFYQINPKKLLRYIKKAHKNKKNYTKYGLKKRCTYKKCVYTKIYFKKCTFKKKYIYKRKYVLKKLNTITNLFQKLSQH